MIEFWDDRNLILCALAYMVLNRCIDPTLFVIRLARLSINIIIIAKKNEEDEQNKAKSQNQTGQVNTNNVNIHMYTFGWVGRCRRNNSLHFVLPKKRLSHGLFFSILLVWLLIWCRFCFNDTVFFCVCSRPCSFGCWYCLAIHILCFSSSKINFNFFYHHTNQNNKPEIIKLQ